MFPRSSSIGKANDGLMVSDGLIAIIKDCIKYRENNNIDQNYYLSGLLAVKKAGFFNDSHIINHIGGLYLEGVETSGTVFHYILFELAAHWKAQEVLKEEKDAVLEESNGEITFEVIQRMKYLDAVFNGI